MRCGTVRVRFGIGMGQGCEVRCGMRDGVPLVER